MEQQNLTDPLDIKHALERKLGYGALRKIAGKCEVSPPEVTNVVYGRRRNKGVLAAIAQIIGQPVLWICPDGSELPKTC